jgi:dihydroxy-acid dehydratase
VHLAAVAGRLGIEIDYQAFDKMGRETPVLIDLKPSGQYYMDDLHKAGGMAPIFREIKHLLNLDCMTVTGRTLGEEIDDMPRRSELAPAAGTAGMRGYLRMFHDHVTQAGSGCDFDFLTSGKADKKTP